MVCCYDLIVVYFYFFYIFVGVDENFLYGCVGDDFVVVYAFDVFRYGSV